MEKVHLSLDVARIFDPASLDGMIKTTSHRVKEFSFNKIDLHEGTRKGCLVVPLAPSFGKLNKESMTGLSEDLKVTIAGANKALMTVPHEQLSFDRVIQMFMQTSLMEPVHTTAVETIRSDILIKGDSSVCASQSGDLVGAMEDISHKGNSEHKRCFLEESNESVAMQAYEWFRRIIGDEDILQCLRIDENAIAAVVSAVNAANRGLQMRLKFPDLGPVVNAVNRHWNPPRSQINAQLQGRSHGDEIAANDIEEGGHILHDEMEVIHDSGRVVTHDNEKIVMDYHRKTIADLCVLRYPDLDNCEFKVCHVVLTAWQDTTHINVYGKDTSGITLIFQSRIFKPRYSVISHMKPEAKNKALEMTDHMFQ